MTNNEIVRDWASAKRPARQIEILAHLNGLSVPKIKEILRENGAHVVAKAYSEGATLAQLYKNYGFDKQTIRDMIVSAGVEIRPKGCVVTPAEAPAEASASESSSPAVYVVLALVAVLVVAGIVVAVVRKKKKNG